MKKYLYLLLSVTLSTSLYAQMPKLDYEELHELNNRILLVDQESFRTFKEDIPSLMKEVWQFHNEIHFKSKQEIDSIRAKNDTRYAIFKKDELFLSTTINAKKHRSDTAKADVEVFTYYRIENPPKKIKRADYVFYFPMVGKKDAYNLASMKLSLQLMQRHLKDIEERKEVSTFLDFTIRDVEANGHQLCDFQLLLNEEQIWKKESEKILANYSGDLAVATPEEIREAVIEEKEVLISMAKLHRYKTVTRANPSDHGGVYEYYFRSFVHPKTAKIYSCTGHMRLSRNIYIYLLPIEFKQHSKMCK